MTKTCVPHRFWQKRIPVIRFCYTALHANWKRAWSSALRAKWGRGAGISHPLIQK